MISCTACSLAGVAATRRLGNGWCHLYSHRPVRVSTRRAHETRRPCLPLASCARARAFRLHCSAPCRSALRVAGVVGYVRLFAQSADDRGHLHVLPRCLPHASRMRASPRASAARHTRAGWLTPVAGCSLYERGSRLAKGGDLVGALPWFIKSRDAALEDPSAHSNLAVTLLRLGRLDAAERAARRAAVLGGRYHRVVSARCPLRRRDAHVNCMPRAATGTIRVHPCTRPVECPRWGLRRASAMLSKSRGERGGAPTLHHAPPVTINPAAGNQPAPRRVTPPSSLISAAFICPRSLMWPPPAQPRSHRRHASRTPWCKTTYAFGRPHGQGVTVTPTARCIFRQRPRRRRRPAVVQAGPRQQRV